MKTKMRVKPSPVFFYLFIYIYNHDEERIVLWIMVLVVEIKFINSRILSQFINSEASCEPVTLSHHANATIIPTLHHACKRNN